MSLSGKTPEFEKFSEIRDTKGLAAAFEWRDNFFADSNREEL